MGKSSDQTFEELELRKLTAETARAEHLAALAELELDQARRDEALAKASADDAGVYHFFGKVDDESVEQAISDLGVWSRAHPGRGLRLLLNSGGGGIAPGLALYDFLRDLADTYGHDIETVALGRVMSMGSVLLQAGDRRVMMRNAAMMLHRPSWEQAGEAHQHEDMQQYIRLHEERILAIYGQRAKLTKDELKDLWHRKRTFLNANQVLKHGLCDEVRGGTAPGASLRKLTAQRPQRRRRTS